MGRSACLSCSADLDEICNRSSTNISVPFDQNLVSIHLILSRSCTPHFSRLKSLRQNVGKTSHFFSLGAFKPPPISSVLSPNILPCIFLFRHYPPVPSISSSRARKPNQTWPMCAYVRLPSMYLKRDSSAGTPHVLLCYTCQ